VVVVGLSAIPEAELSGAGGIGAKVCLLQATCDNTMAIEIIKTKCLKFKMTPVNQPFSTSKAMPVLK
jgi:hypothetical protein